MSNHYIDTFPVVMVGRDGAFGGAAGRQFADDRLPCGANPGAAMAKAGGRSSFGDLKNVTEWVMLLLAGYANL
jgi:hypothetical protein